MKFRRYIFIILSFLSIAIITYGQNSAVREIKWEGVQNREAELFNQQVLSFADATYSDDNDLPYYIERIVANSNSSYQVNLLNIEYEPLTTDESLLVDVELSESPQVITFLTQDRDVSYYNIQILPFVKIGNEVFRISSFVLDLKKSESSLQSPEIVKELYANQSVLASGKFVKIAVTESGIYKLSYEDLNSMGIDPANVRIFGYGGATHDQNLANAKPDDLPEVAIYMNKGSDGVFNAGDYILFYAKGVVDWQYDSAKRNFIHKLNHYSTKGYYFVTSDAGVGKRIDETSAVTPPDGANVVNVNQFVDYKVHEIEKYNLGKTGKVFYGEEFNVNRPSHSFNFNFPNISSSDVKVILDMAVTNGIASNIDLVFNNDQSKRIEIPNRTVDLYTVGFPIYNTYSFSNTEQKGDLSFKMTYNISNTSQKAYLNYLIVNARRHLKVDNHELFFRNYDNLNVTGVYNRFRVTTDNPNIQIWDITDAENTKIIPTTRSGNQIEFIDKANELKQYLAIDPTAKSAFTLKPEVIGEVANQNIHALPSADLTIITHPKFLSQAERLAAAHRDIDNLSVNVLTTEQVYNEFSSGTPDATAYRRVMKMWYDRTNRQGPKYLLLFGRGSFDNRGIQNNSGDNLILTYQADNSLNEVKSYVTDDYFGFLDNGEGVSINSDLLDLGIGRLPVVTTKHADDVVDKMISYMNNEIKGIWKNQITFVADDGDGGLHMRDIDTKVARLLQNENPAFQQNKIYLDAFKKEFTASGESYPLAEAKLKSQINSGVFYLNFMGHANRLGWTKERILSDNDIKVMYNNKLPLWMAATCDFVMFDRENISAGEYVLLNPVGGGIGLFSAARVVYADENEKLNSKFSNNLFKRDAQGNMPRLGDVVRKSKNEVGAGMNKLSYMLFGNPALKLNYPNELEVKTETINGKPADSGEVLKALSVNEITAYVTDRNGNKVSNFNGTAEITIYDKEQSITTLNNQNGGAITYNDRPNKIFSGKAKVVNGQFTFTVMVPRDIRYNFGSGRINYYASETDGDREAQGYFEDFLIGGFMESQFDDTEGPNMMVYLNSPDFVSGGKVNEEPLFIAHISDENGINTVGSGIGHDLKLIIDFDPHSTYTLNEYFEADENSYQNGIVKFKMPKLEAGKHTLTFHAWDLLNNSNSVSLDFEVVPGLSPELIAVSNYPNPVKSYTKFVVEHDRPETFLESRLEIFDLAGRKIFEQQYNSSDNMVWSLTGSDGTKVSQGVYVYRISIKTLDSEFVSKANKIIVVGQ